MVGSGRLSSHLRERIAGLVDDARAARRVGDWKLMRALAEAVAVLDPENPEARELLTGSATRRQMTLLFCDIVGSTQIADALDPEEVTALLRVYRSTCAEAVEEFDGYIDDHRGDGMLVLFGYPEVHEDDARLGVLCGLKIIETLPGRLRSLGTEAARRLRVRIAVHTDLVVVDDVGVAGATANEAARIQEVAGPDSVVISDTTQALVTPWFDTRSAGCVELRGVSRPIEVFTVLGERPAPRTGAPAVPASPFVGRQTEFDQFAALWRRVAEPRTRVTSSTHQPTSGVLLVSGPPGIGKTRFIAEAVRTLHIPSRKCACTRLSSNVSLHSFRPLLQEACSIEDDDDPGVRLGKLRARVRRLPGPGTGTDLPFLASALDIPLSMLGPSPDVGPALLRQFALQTAALLVQSLHPDEPLMLFVDDLHWADQSTLDLLGAVLAAPRADLMVVLAAREGFTPPWPDLPVQRLQLEALDPSDAAELARLISESATVSPERCRELIERSDGVPLFLEELLRTAGAVDSGQIPHRSVRYGSYKIPPALRDPLLARLALPQVDLDLAQAAATIGRDFDPDLLQRLVGADGVAFAARLATLFDAGLIEQVGHRIRFRHELIREVAYETQRQAVLQQRHSSLADDLLARDLVMSRRASDELTVHLEGALRFDEAIAAHLRVAQADQAVGSYVESTQRLTRVLALLERVPDGAERRQTELVARGLRSFSAVMAGGYAAPEAAEDYPRCVQLSEESHAAHEVLPYLLRSWSYYAFRGNLREAERVSQAAGQKAVEAGLQVPGQQMGDGAIAFFRGDFERARREMEEFTTNAWALHALARPPEDWPLPNDPLASAYAHLVPTSWIGGTPGESEVWAQRALQRAEQMEFPYGPFNHGYVSSLLALTRNLEGDHVGAARIGSELIQLGERHGFAMWQLAGVIQSLVSAIAQGAHGLIDQLVEQVDVWRLVLAADVWTPYWLTQVGFAQLHAGLNEEALGTLQDALSVATVTGSRFYSAETLRGRGQARVRLGDLDGFQDMAAAVDLAQSQHAPCFEWRARNSLALAMAR